MDELRFHLDGVVRSKSEYVDFDGPLELILQLLSRNRVEIQDIRISALLEQYLDYLAEMRRMDLEIASEFVAMASHLTYIKAKTVLAGTEPVEELDELKNSLEELRRRREYERAKHMADLLAPMAARGEGLFTKQPEPLGQEKGVLLLYNNFIGNYLTNDMAAELLRLDGFRVEQAAFYDDMGMAGGEPKENRGGRIGIAYAIRICAEAAKRGATLEETARLARKAAERTVTLGVNVEPEKDRVTFGMGISGEPGFSTLEGTNVHDTAEETVRLLWEDLNPQASDRIFMLVNRLRLTSYSDSFVMAECLYESLSRRTDNARMSVGGYMQVTDSYGYTVTLLRADEELASYLTGTCTGDGFII